MKKIPTKALALVCSVALLFSMTACNAAGSNSGHNGRNNGGGNSKPSFGGETEPSYSTPVPTVSDPTTPVNNGGGFIPTSEDLTYPDHVATAEEIHPYNAPGAVTGKEAQELLSEIEYDTLHHAINCYADVEILFENPEKFGFDIQDVTWGDFISIDEYDDEKAFYQTQLDRLLTINYESLQDDDRLCYDKMVYDCEEDIYAYSYTAFEYYSMVFNYLVGPQSEILFVMEVYSFDNILIYPFIFWIF